KFEETAKAVMARRKLEWTDTEAEILQKVFDLSRNYRIWEKNS
ncbi:MAG TPA: glucose-1-phosphate thymidylyltransferase, partial [Algoriphagus sp.]|nr:glucose-1-phosphate thymidylyltransferase [Algoriphagus sp.]